VPNNDANKMFGQKEIDTNEATKESKLSSIKIRW
jgi:hypothetical protein